MKNIAEFEILKASHKFIREDIQDAQNSWNDCLAEKYYQSLYKEFALCDLKHYKSGNVRVSSLPVFTLFPSHSILVCPSLENGRRGSLWHRRVDLCQLSLPSSYYCYIVFPKTNHSRAPIRLCRTGHQQECLGQSRPVSQMFEEADVEEEQGQGEASRCRSIQFQETTTWSRGTHPIHVTVLTMSFVHLLLQRFFFLSLPSNPGYGLICITTIPMAYSHLQFSTSHSHSSDLATTPANRTLAS